MPPLSSSIITQAMWVFVRLPHAADVSCVSHAELPTGIEVAKAITGVQARRTMGGEG